MRRRSVVHCAASNTQPRPMATGRTPMSTAPIDDPSATGRSRPSRSTPGRPPTRDQRAGAADLPDDVVRVRRHRARRRLFALAELGNIYTRIMNPTQDVVEQRIAALEGGVGRCPGLRPGRRDAAILNIASAGDHIVSSPRLYGGTYNLFHYTLPKLGIRSASSTTPTTRTPGARRPAEHQGVLRRDGRQPALDILDIERRRRSPTTPACR